MSYSLPKSGLKPVTYNFQMYECSRDEKTENGIYHVWTSPIRRPQRGRNFNQIVEKRSYPILGCLHCTDLVLPLLDEENDTYCLKSRVTGTCVEARHWHRLARPEERNVVEKQVISDLDQAPDEMRDIFQ